MISQCTLRIMCTASAALAARMPLEMPSASRRRKTNPPCAPSSVLLTAANKTLEGAHGGLVFRRREADGISNGMRAASAADAVHIILRVHWEIIIHHVGNPVNVDAACRDVSG